VVAAVEPEVVGPEVVEPVAVSAAADVARRLPNLAVATCFVLPWQWPVAAVVLHHYCHQYHCWVDSAAVAVVVSELLVPFVESRVLPAVHSLAAAVVGGLLLVLEVKHCCSPRDRHYQWWHCSSWPLVAVVKLY